MDSSGQLSEEVSRNRGIAESTLASPAERPLQLHLFPDNYIGKTDPQDNSVSLIKCRSRSATGPCRLPLWPSSTYPQPTVNTR
jgi:hypothetical protein